MLNRYVSQLFGLKFTIVKNSYQSDRCNFISVLLHSCLTQLRAIFVQIWGGFALVRTNSFQTFSKLQWLPSASGDQLVKATLTILEVCVRPILRFLLSLKAWSPKAALRSQTTQHKLREHRESVGLAVDNQLHF